MQLTFLGGADEVGASSTLVEIGGKRVLVDAGIRISPKTSRGLSGDQLPDLYAISERGGPDVVLVTHAHTDHTGALPLVLDQYPEVPVMATSPTIDLTRTLLADAQRIMQGQLDAEGEIPLYDEVAAQRLLTAFRPVTFGQPLRLGDDLQVTYHRAGHILGAGMLVLESSEGVLVISGDVSFSPQRTVTSAQPPRVKADALIMESTYGGKLHANRKAEERRLILTLQQVINRGGKALIPAFAIGRAQEVIQILHNHRDVLSAPVYVDGMVRVVCDIYAQHADELPGSTVRWARGEPLFFRRTVHPINSREQREEVARGDEPCIIVASSGMLTGGASVVYARHLAGDERSAIFLTGYQDEEAPGRALQNAVEAKQRGETPAIWLGGKKVPAACQIDTYSLSAHADEGELLTMAQLFDPERIFLVHGDGKARRSIAEGLLVRDLPVSRPSIGQTLTLSFAPRPWLKARITQAGIGDGQPLDPRALWEALAAHEGQTVTAGELARVWWGDEENARELQQVLHDDILYFAPDWRKKHEFTVRTGEQVEQALRRRAIIAAYPDLVGQVVVLRNVNDAIRLGIVTGYQEEAFEADVLGAKGRVRTADELVWPLGPAAADDLQVLRELKTEADALADRVLPPVKVRELVEAGQPVDPVQVIDEESQVALLAAVLALLKAGAQLVDGGLLPTRMPPEGGVVAQHTAQQIALDTLPEEARLRKVGLHVERHQLSLVFDFPAAAARQYAEAIAEVEALTGWEVVINKSVNQQALGEVLVDLLPADVQLVKGPAYHIAEGRVEAQLSGEADIADTFRAITGFVLDLGGGEKRTPRTASRPARQEAGPVEQNRARQIALEVLPEEARLRKVGLRVDQHKMSLGFDFPHTALSQYGEAIARVEARTGWQVTVEESVNQQALGEVLADLLSEDVQLVKGPSYYMDEQRVVVQLSEAADIADQFQAITGFTLEVTTSDGPSSPAPQPARQQVASVRHDPVEQNQARQIALEAFPADAYLDKVGMQTATYELVLHFAFPIAASRYADTIREVAQRTGWTVTVADRVNQNALAEVLGQLLPEGGTITKGPSYYLADRRVEAVLHGAGDTQALQRTFKQITGFDLVVEQGGEQPAAITGGPTPSGQEQMEVNAAFDLIRQALEPLGLYKVGLKGDAILLSFITPQVGERYTDQIEHLQERTGWHLMVNPNPNTIGVAQAIHQIIEEAGLHIDKGPGLHYDQAEAVVTLSPEPTARQWTALVSSVDQATGYRLVHS